MRRFSLTFAVLVAATGCTDINSADLKTSGMSADLQVVSDGSGTTTVAMQLHADNNATDLVNLSPGDSLTATTGSQSSGMAKSSFLGDIWYTASFSGASSAGTTFTVALNRSSDVSAPNSLATLPQPFNITAPPPNTTQTFSRATQDITVKYDSTGTADGMGWSVNGSCVNYASGTVAGDTGTFTISKGTLVATDMSQKTMSCQVTITLSRSRVGTIDSHFGYSGSATAAQQRSFTFMSTP